MNKLFRLLLLGIVIGTVFTYLWIFSLAYTTESKSVLVTINEYNEANLEMWLMFPLTLCSSIYLLYDGVKELYNEKK